MKNQIKTVLLLGILFLSGCSDPKPDAVIRDMKLTHRDGSVNLEGKGGDALVSDKLKITWISHEEAEKDKDQLSFGSIDKDGNQACLTYRKASTIYFLAENDDFDCDGGYYLL